MSRQIITFHGGVHPPEHKAESSHYPIRTAPLPARLILSLQQSIGSAAKPLVKVGDEVAKGQLIAAADGMISAALHAPTSGRIESVDLYPIAHPSGLSDACIVLIPDGKDQWQDRPLLDWRNAEPNVVRTYLRDMGVVGLGGAVFPSHLKLSSKTSLDTLIINGAECEPYITCDDRLMQERAAEIIAGILMVQSLLNAKQVLIGIEDNKPEAAAALRNAIIASRSKVVAGIDVVQVPTLYPSGGAKQLIKLLCNIEVPSGVRSTDLGVQCFNVATIHSIYCALAHAEPVIRRVVTITGNVERPGNYEALIGTPLQDLLKAAGDKGSTGYIYGGPMMGFELPSLAVGLSKAGNCVIAKTPADFPEKPREMPCIRCSKCATACPAELQPMDLFWFAKSKNFGKAQERNLFDCIECGACAYVCPSNIRLVDYYRFAKSEIWAAEKTKHAADLARERFEFREFRAEREKQEKAERLAAKASQKLAQAVASVDPEEAIRAAKIKAAMAKAAVASEAPARDSTATSEAEQAAQLAAEKKAKIAAAMARAAAKKAEADATVPVVRYEDQPMAPSQTLPASSLDKTDRTKEILDKRREERARIAAMSPEERSEWEAEKQAEIAEAKAAAALRKIESAMPEEVPAPSLDEEKAAKIRASMAKRDAEKARLAAMSPEEKAALAAERQVRIDAAMAAKAAKAAKDE
ncbi:electron transport complex subunit RsxC [Iodobacter fluviatilis]|uniref:Ion-translocating oxidoreductase complex subunit C n=1 Tax=Iodobacter fluviatilis TaxID=537 RepID=A0A377SY56_9NEIS|nr:electron transport complex subunit RsxC [Iodobacter fluviatilis]TCU85070.1 electron transport complex protein RnfC [Iodobacter fluviatilis]STR45246.1 Nitrogen fixation protein rnfC [Iodobacter fluviatilis]